MSNSKSSNWEILQFNPSINNVLRIKLPKNSIYNYFELNCTGKVWIKWNFELTVFELTLQKDRKVAEILKKVWIKWNFELTVFELTGPNLYSQMNIVPTDNILFIFIITK